MAPSAITTTETYTTYSIKGEDLADRNHGGDETHASWGAARSKQLVLEKLKERVAGVDVDSCLPGEEDAFYVADLGEVYRQHLRWKLNLGRVKPFYGKCRTAHARHSTILTLENSCQVQSRRRSPSSHGPTWQWFRLRIESRD